MESLFLQPLMNLRLKLRNCPPSVFVIDALDECTSEAEIADLISLLGQALSNPKIPVIHILLTSRSEAHIHEAIQEEGVRPLVCEIPVKISGEGVAKIISLDGADVDNDICIFLEQSFSKLRGRNSNFPQPTKDELALLASRAGRRFIVASTMVKFIDDGYKDPRGRLQLMLKLTSELLPGTEVYKLYDGILSTCADPKRAYLHLSVVAALADPLPISQISKLLGPGEGKDAENALVQLRSVMDIPDDSNLPVNIYHSSIRDYVSDPTNCDLPEIQPMTSPHSILAHSSLSLMITDIPGRANAALLDALLELKKQSKAMQSDDIGKLKYTLSFIVKPPEPLQVIIYLLWLRGARGSELQQWLGDLNGRSWLRSQPGKDWLQTPAVREWLQTLDGREWLRSQPGEDWLQTPAVSEWLQTWSGREWLQTQGGREWLQTRGGREWLQTPGVQTLLQTWSGREWLQTRGGQEWLQTRGGREWLTWSGREWLTWSGREWLTWSGREWLQTRGGRKWLQTWGGREWLRTSGGREWLQTRGGREWLQTRGGREWLQTPDGREWLQTWVGKQWLETPDGQEWLETQRGRKWLQTQGGRKWLQTRGGQEWLQTQGGQEWLQTRGGQEWLQTQGGRKWLQTRGGQEWLQTLDGQAWSTSCDEGDLGTWDKENGLLPRNEEDETSDEEDNPGYRSEREQLRTLGWPEQLQVRGGLKWLQTRGGREWLQTPGGREWLRTLHGRDWLETQGGQGWLSIQGGQECLWTLGGREWLWTRGGQEWLRTQGEQKWLGTQGGQDWLQTNLRYWLCTQSGKDWLQSPSGRDWLRGPSGRDWLQMPGGHAWQSTPAASIWIIMEDFSRTLEAMNECSIGPELLLSPAFQVIQHVKSLPDFLMFPVFLALLHHDNPVPVLPHDLPDIDIIRAITAFTIFAEEAQERGRSASDTLKYASQNFAVHLLRAPKPWDGILHHIFKSFWNQHLVSWLERQWCLKGLRSCLVILSAVQKLAKEHLQPEAPGSS